MTLELFEDMSIFWCIGCEEWLDKELDELKMLKGEMYCASCTEQIKKKEIQ